MYSKRLCRQIRKSFGDDFEKNLQEFLSKSNEQPSNENGQICENMKTLVSHLPVFLKTIDDAYAQLEEKIQLSTHSLETSSKELSETNYSLLKINTDFEAMLNCLGQGFVMINRDGICLSGYSKICETLFETIPEGKSLASLLKIPAEKHKTVLQWIELLFLDVTDFSDLSKIGPTHFSHSQGLVIDLEFKPIRSSDGQMLSIVMVATDKTETIAARLHASKMMAHAQLVSSILKDKNQFLTFLKFTKNAIKTIIADIDKIHLNEEYLRYLKFQLHTLKGGAGSFGFTDLQSKIHLVENSLHSFFSTGELDPNFKQKIFDIEKCFLGTLEQNKELFDSALAFSGPIREIDLDSLIHFKNSFSDDSQSRILESFEKRFIQLSAEKVFRRFSSTLDVTSQNLNLTPPQLHVHSDGTRLTPEAMEDFLSSLVHAFRNIICHGIENDETRSALGKPLPAQVNVFVSTQVSNFEKKLVIEIADDGRGINPEVIKNKLYDLGKSQLAHSMTENELINYVFEPDFSTSQTVNEYSGRGVGMSALKEEVLKLGGQISVDSELGKGVKLKIHLPENYRLKIAKTKVA